MYRRESILPESKEHWLKMRSEVLTSTEISALFGVNPYMTEFELYLHKSAKQPIHINENERMKWGTRLQDAIANGIAEDKGWSIRPMAEFITLPDLRLGSSFDYEIRSQDSLLEIKNVDSLIYRDKWIDDGITLEAPPHIELQLQHQMLVAGKKKGWICAFVGGNSITMIERDLREDISNAIIKKSKEFWKNIDNNYMPEPNFDTDSRAVIEMNSFADQGTVMLADDRVKMLAIEYKTFSDAEKMAQKNKEKAKAQILSIIGSSEKVKGEGFSISAGMIAGADVSFKRETYRGFKINFTKQQRTFSL